MLIVDRVKLKKLQSHYIDEGRKLIVLSRNYTMPRFAEMVEELNKAGVVPFFMLLNDRSRRYGMFSQHGRDTHLVRLCAHSVERYITEEMIEECQEDHRIKPLVYLVRGFRTDGEGNVTRVVREDWFRPQSQYRFKYMYGECRRVVWSNMSLTERDLTFGRIAILIEGSGDMIDHTSQSKLPVL